MTTANPVVVATVLVHANEYGLHEVLRLLAAQHRRPDSVVVVDNASEPPVTLPPVGELAVRLIRSPDNLGVGGGHNLALRHALEHEGADAVWMLEHDTFPDPDCLAELLRARVDGRPGVVVPDATRNNYERHWAMANDGVLAAQFTFNGPLLDREIVEQVGPVNEAYFIGQEDWEYSRRVVAAGFGIARCSTAVVVHANKGDGRFPDDISPTRLYYSARNFVAERGPVSLPVRLAHTARAVAAGLLEMVTPGRGRAFAAARWWAQRDGSRGRMGRQSHRFMRRR